MIFDMLLAKPAVAGVAVVLLTMLVTITVLYVAKADVERKLANAQAKVALVEAESKLLAGKLEQLKVDKTKLEQQAKEAERITAEIDAKLAKTKTKVVTVKTDGTCKGAMQLLREGVK